MRTITFTTSTISLAVVLNTPINVHAFTSVSYQYKTFSNPFFSSQLRMREPFRDNIDLEMETDDKEDVKRQWDLFMKHHARGRWRGTWTTYDYMGDEIDSTLASVILEPQEEVGDFNLESVSHTHEIIVGATAADCDTCFDSMDTKTLPVADYLFEADTCRSNLSKRKIRLASVGMCVGPTLLRSGAMSTELILRHGDSRLRAVFMHGPAWEKGIEPGSCPPMGLKLFRCMIAKESVDRDFPGPTKENEAKNPPEEGNAQFFRPVPPFQWHAQWEGSSWTYGKQQGDKGWKVEDMDEGDAWHGRPTGDNENVWNLRLPGGILVQCPRMITGDQVALCRMAWLPEGERGPHNLGTLLRLETGITALEPMVLENDMDQVVGFHPPSMVNLRCDTLRKTGELTGTSLLDRDKLP